MKIENEKYTHRKYINGAKKTLILTLTIFVFLIIILTIGGAFAQTTEQMNHYYEIQLVYDKIYDDEQIVEQINYNSLEVIPSEIELKTPGSNYIAEITDFENNTLNLTFFGISTDVIYDIADSETEKIVGGGIRKLNHSEVILYLHYNDRAQTINIYDKNLRKKLSINVAEFSKVEAGKLPISDITKITKTEEKTKEIIREIEEEKLNEKRLLIAALFILGLVVLIVIIFKFLVKKEKG